MEKKTNVKQINGLVYKAPKKKTHKMNMNE